MELLFSIQVSVDRPIVVGQDGKNGRRQLIPILSGKLWGHDPEGSPLAGTVLPGGVDSQVIRPDGTCELCARYGIRLSDGRGIYINNVGIRTVPQEYVRQVLEGQFIDPGLYYFATTPRFEVYDESLRWLEKHIFICKATRKPDCVIIDYYIVR